MNRRYPIHILLITYSGNQTDTVLQHTRKDNTLYSFCSIGFNVCTRFSEIYRFAQRSLAFE